jgi:outer membrane protein OmpA-like peptidoglycan-associated protein
MKDHAFLTLLLAVALAVPAFAQGSSSTTNSTPAPPTTGTLCNTAPPTSNGDFWNGAEPNVANLVGHPITSKKYVQGQIQPLQDCLNQLDNAATANAAMVKDVDARSQHGVELASTRLKEADQHATDADSRAQAAQLAASQTTEHVSRVEQMVGGLDQYKGGAQTEIDFDAGQAALSKKAKDALDEMAAPLKDQRSYVIEVRGYSAGQGQAAIVESRRIADSVVRYLVNTHQIPVHRIYTIAMGNAPADAQHGKRRGGRVEVSLLQNDLASSVQH